MSHSVRSKHSYWWRMAGYIMGTTGTNSSSNLGRKISHQHERRPSDLWVNWHYPKHCQNYAMQGVHKLHRVSDGDTIDWALNICILNTPVLDPAQYMPQSKAKKVKKKTLKHSYLHLSRLKKSLSNSNNSVRDDCDDEYLKYCYQPHVYRYTWWAHRIAWN